MKAFQIEDSKPQCELPIFMPRFDEAWTNRQKHNFTKGSHLPLIDWQKSLPVKIYLGLSLCHSFLLGIGQALSGMEVL